MWADGARAAALVLIAGGQGDEGLSRGRETRQAGGCVSDSCPMSRAYLMRGGARDGAWRARLKRTHGSLSEVVVAIEL